MDVTRQDGPEIRGRVVLAHELPFTLGVLTIEPATGASSGKRLVTNDA